MSILNASNTHLSTHNWRVAIVADQWGGYRPESSVARLILLQEPWVIDGRICGLSTKGYRLAYIQDSGRPKACVMVKPKELYQVNEPPSRNYSPLTVTRVQVQWAVRSFRPFKSSGSDIIPGDIQHGENIIIDSLASTMLVSDSFISLGAGEYLG